MQLLRPFLEKESKFQLCEAKRIDGPELPALSRNSFAFNMHPDVAPYKEVLFTQELRTCYGARTERTAHDNDEIVSKGSTQAKAPNHSWSKLQRNATSMTEDSATTRGHPLSPAVPAEVGTRPRRWSPARLRARSNPGSGRRACIEGRQGCCACGWRGGRGRRSDLQTTRFDRSAAADNYTGCEWYAAGEKSGSAFKTAWTRRHIVDKKVRMRRPESNYTKQMT